METTSLFAPNYFTGNSEPAREPTPTAIEPATNIFTPAEQELFTNLTPEERKQFETTVRNTDFTQPGFTASYGADAIGGIAALNTESLKISKTKDLGAIGTCISALIHELKSLDPSSSSGKRRGIFSIFSKVQSAFNELNTQLKTAEENINTAVELMKNHQNQLQDDNNKYEELYWQNLSYFRALTFYIMAGKVTLANAKKTTLVELTQNANTGQLDAIEKLNAYKSDITAFERLLSEFESSRLLCFQIAPAIRMAQENNTALINQFTNIINVAVPAWRTQMMLAINQQNSQEAAQAVQSARDFTNALIRENATMLHDTSIAVAQLATSSIIANDTLEYSNAQLIDMLAKVFTIKDTAAKNMSENSFKKEEWEKELTKALLMEASSDANI